MTLIIFLTLIALLLIPGTQPYAAGGLLAFIGFWFYPVTTGLIVLGIGLIAYFVHA